MSLHGQEFYGLCCRYLELHGDQGTDDYWTVARLGNLRILKTGRRLVVEHVVTEGNRDVVKPIWSNEGGFQYERWYEYLEILRRELILDRMADV